MTATPGAPSTVHLRALSRTFGALVAVDALSFEVAPGELFGLVGPDGAGKTTTLRMLAGVLRPTSGDAMVAGLSVAQDPEAVKPHIAYMAQRFGLYEDLTVQENLDFYADLYGVGRRERLKRQERLYAFSRLGEFNDRLAGALSGGMKQKLSLSCALIHQPTILLLDDLFQFHADLLPATLGVTKAVALGMVLAHGVAWVLCWRADIARTRWLILASSGVGSLCALAADLFGNPDRSAALLVEDGAKLLAIVAWAVYFTTTTVDIVASAIERRPDPDHDATPEDRAAKLIV